MLKRAAVILLALFTFALAPVYPGLRNAEAAPPPDIFKLLEELEHKNDAPTVTCESSDGSDKCVPKYRLSEDINESSAARAVKWIEAANKAGADEILLELNTPGGSVGDGFELARAIEDSEAPVTCIVDGDGESMGFYLLQSCDHRVMTKRSKLMAHEPALGGMFRGQPNQWQAIAEMMKAERDAMAEHCAHRLKISLAEYHAKTDGSKMWFLNHAEALKVGAIDEIGGSVKALHKKMRAAKTKSPKQD